MFSVVRGDIDTHCYPVDDRKYSNRSETAVTASSLDENRMAGQVSPSGATGTLAAGALQMTSAILTFVVGVFALAADDSGSAQLQDGSSVSSRSVCRLRLISERMFVCLIVG